MIRLLSSVLLIIISIPSFGQITFDNKILVMENDVIRQTISFSKGSIKPVSVFSKSNDIELLATNNAAPWFEFIVNNNIITSGQSIWKVLNYEIRKMNNGGRFEHSTTNCHHC